MPTSDHKNPANEAQKYVRAEQHAKIKVIADELLADSDEIDLTQTGQLESFTVSVAKKLSTDHKWFKVVADAKSPVKHRLYKSLFDHLHRILSEQGGPLHDTNIAEVTSVGQVESNEDEEQQQISQIVDSKSKQKLENLRKDVPIEEQIFQMPAQNTKGLNLNQNRVDIVRPVPQRQVKETTFDDVGEKIFSKDDAAGPTKYP